MPKTHNLLNLTSNIAIIRLFLPNLVVMATMVKHLNYTKPQKNLDIQFYLRDTESPILPDFINFGCIPILKNLLLFG